MVQTRNQLQKLKMPKFPNGWLVFLGILALYTLLIIPTLTRLGIGWDEEVDLRIARAYLTTGGFFFGVPLDSSQVRLPMFTVALVYRLLGVNDLLTARSVTVLAGAFTLLGIYTYGKENVSRNTGLLAAGLLAINPFFLSFARLAFTESDVYLACTLTWLLVVLARLQKKPTIGRAGLAGLLLGLTISSKATVIVILPAIWAAFIFFEFSINKNKTFHNDSPGRLDPAWRSWFWAGWALIVMLVGIYSLRLLNLSNSSFMIRLLHYGLVGLGWLVPMVWAFRFRDRTANYIPLAGMITSIGLLTFVIFPPDHLTNPAILNTIFSRADNEISFNLAFLLEVMVLHSLSIILKSTPVLGIALMGGAVIGLIQWRRSALVLPVFVGFCYFVGLFVLPLGQTFYTIPILPIISLLLADLLVRQWRYCRLAILILGILITAFWGAGIVQSYPDYHLNGYQWLGERAIFGRSSIGYRSIVYTPSDGVQQAIEWLNANAQPGEVAILYLHEMHVVRFVSPDPYYHIMNGFDDKPNSPPDYIVIHINATIDQGHGIETPVGDIIKTPVDPNVLEREYSQVYFVQRAFGLRMVSVWQRN
jgi:hypothetical protein